MVWAALLIGVIGCQRSPAHTAANKKLPDAILSGQDSARAPTSYPSVLGSKDMASVSPMAEPVARKEVDQLAACEKFLKRQSDFPQDVDHWKKKKRCFAFKDRFFALIQDSLHIERCRRFNTEGGSHVQVRWSLVEGSSDKAWALGTARGTNFHPAASEPGANQFTDFAFEEDWPCGNDGNAVDVESINDYDGDGNPELVLLRTHIYYEAPAGFILSIWTIKDDELIPYPHSPPFQEVETEDLIEDVDRDGRPDFLTAGAYSASTEPVCGGIESTPAVRPIFLYHARPDGTFSETDDVAKDFLRRTCPSPPDITELVKAGKIGGINTTVTCARAWGMSAQAVLAAVQPLCKDLADGCPYPDKLRGAGCPKWLRNLAAVPPRVLLNPSPHRRPQ